MHAKDETFIKIQYVDLQVNKIFRDGNCRKIKKVFTFKTFILW